MILQKLNLKRIKMESYSKIFITIAVICYTMGLWSFWLSIVDFIRHCKTCLTVEETYEVSKEDLTVRKASFILVACGTVCLIINIWIT
jgi:hypothetical protein